MSTAFFTKPELTSERKEFYGRLDQKNVGPLWESLMRLIPPEPSPQCIPALWRYDELRPLILEAARLITAKEAERRVLFLENPGCRGQSRITQSMYAGLQLVMPGEITPTHRHVTSALRFIIEGVGAYTAVDGERTTLHPGDFVLTPSWTFHDHGNESPDPVVWMDGLDIHIVNLFDASFSERYPGPDVQPIARPEGDALARYGANLLPLEHKPTSLTAPVFNYPYSRSREALERVYRNGPMDACHGVKMQYVNPATGGSPIPTIAAFLQYLPAGFRGAPYRATDATIFCCSEGGGRSHIGPESFDWKEHDIFVVPSWCPVRHETDRGGVLFSFSDRPAQKAFGFWREEILQP
jgi:gentisate 1,2-dioxygenase